MSLYGTEWRERGYGLCPYPSRCPPFSTIPARCKYMYLGGGSNEDVVIKHLNMSQYSQLIRFNNDEVYLVTLFFGYLFHVRPPLFISVLSHYHPWSKF
jgi:hypothetical protein